MSEHERGQVTRAAAEVYEDFFIPALFREWTDRVADAAAIEARQRVLDVACGTGILTRAVADRVGREGTVVGLDVNEGMLAVAQRKSPAIEWRHGRAEALPFERETFDAVVSQFGLMFFEDRQRALREMLRVLHSGGRLVVAVWASLDTAPGYAAMTELLRRLFGEAIADALRAPFALGDRRALGALLADAGIDGAEITTHPGTARFPSIQSWIHTDVKGWTLADRIDDAELEQLLREADRELSRFAAADGTITFAMPAHIVTARKP